MRIATRRQMKRVPSKPFRAGFLLLANLVLLGCDAERDQRLKEFDKETDLAFYNAYPSWSDSLAVIRAGIEHGSMTPATAREQGREFRDRWRGRNPALARMIDDSNAVYQGMLSRLEAAQAERQAADRVAEGRLGSSSAAEEARRGVCKEFVMSEEDRARRCNGIKYEPTPGTPVVGIGRSGLSVRRP
jgi:hypothetical protein